MLYKSINLIVTIFLSFIVAEIFAQDTVTVMQYNLLQYSNSASACIPIAEKTGYIKTICKYVKPDILGVNELYPNATTADYLLNNALNTDGVTYYKRSTYSNLAGSDLVNALYYNDNKLGLISNTPIQTVYRDINIFKLFYRASNLATTHDTIYLRVVVAHLKASNTPTDAASRSQMTNDLMNYLTNINVANNYLFQGDCNLYTSAEQAYQNLISSSNANMRFYDPINRAGNWNGNSSFKDIHTQSTHNSGSSCYITGGLDDRFDLILISNDVRTGNKKVSYIAGSYKAIGQDGNHFNNDLTASPANNSAPTAVINALYGNSDHLPVSLKLKVTPTSSGIESMESNGISNLEIVNPFADKLEISFFATKPSKSTIQIINSLGTVCHECKIAVKQDENNFIIPVNLPKGIYFLKIIGENKIQFVKKIVRN